MFDLFNRYEAKERDFLLLTTLSVLSLKVDSRISAAISVLALVKFGWDNFTQVMELERSFDGQLSLEDRDPMSIQCS